MSEFSHAADALALEHVCALHSRIIPSEEYAKTSEPEEQRRMILQLQQKSKALENEIANRRELENELRHVTFQRDEFLSMAGHELRTPLTAMRLQLQYLERVAHQMNYPDLLTAVQQSRAQEAKLTWLIEQLTDVRRLRLGKVELNIEPTDLTKVVLEYISRFKKNAPVVFQSEGEVVGEWDGERLGRVVDGLVSNAIKFGGSNAVQISLSKDQRSAYIIVKDHGIGIKPEDQKRIFDRFERLGPNDNFSGLGLGLYLAKQIVEAHGGQISVESLLGQGSTFVVELPLHREAT